MNGCPCCKGEPVRGLPERLPPGERLLWQGAPEARLLAARVFHLRALAIYFALLVGGHSALSLRDGAAPGELMTGGIGMLALAVFALGMLGGLALAYAKTSVFSITDRRLVLRFGVALPMVVNIPLRHIQAADMRRYADGSGDIVFSVTPHKTVSYITLWPNVRPWKFLRPQPALRCLADVQGAARTLAAVAPAAAGAASPAGKRLRSRGNSSGNGGANTVELAVPS